MRKIFCDMCQAEITEKLRVNGTFTNPDGLLVSVSISGPEMHDLCKDCVIEIVRHGVSVDWRHGRTT